MSKNIYDTKTLGIAEDFKGVDRELEKVNGETIKLYITKNKRREI